MKELTLENLDDLIFGSAILGSGGGGDPYYSYLMARYEIEKGGAVSIIGLSELKGEEQILPIGVMGAPLAEIEKLPSGREYKYLIDAYEKSTGKKVDIIMPFEIGGGNAFTPLMIASQLGIPVLDADMMGRAFPELQMSSCNMLGISPAPGIFADSLGNTAVIFAKDSMALEKIGREIVVTMGSCCLVSFFSITGSQAQTCTIPKSISKAIGIGKAFRQAKNKGKEPLEAILSLCKGICLGSGKITDIDRIIEQGFISGNVVIQNKDEKIEVGFQNEFLAVKINGEIIATTPDILVLLEQETGSPIASESIQYGLKVHVLAIPAPDLWKTKEGLALVGPRYFGYEVDYQAIEK